MTRRDVILAAAVATATMVAGAEVAGCNAAVSGTGGATSDRPAADGPTPSPTTGTTAVAPLPPPAPPPPPRIAVFGDSTALMTSFGLAQWLGSTGRGIYVDGRVDLGCGIVRRGIRRDQLGQGPNNPVCQHREHHWMEMLDRNRPDLAVVQIGPWDIIDHQLEGDPTWRGPGDPVYDAELRREMVAVVDLFATRGTHVAWLTLPRQRVEVGQAPGSESAPGTDPARARRFNELLHELPTLRPGVVTILDLAGWLAQPGVDPEIRPVGIHVSFETTHTQAEQWLGPAVVDAYEASWDARRRRNEPANVDGAGGAGRRRE